MPDSHAHFASSRFDRATLDRIKERHCLSEIIRRDGVVLKPRQRDFFGLCPFHSEDTSSFTVNDDKGFFHCFGCGAHGDLFGWLRQKRHLSLPEAVEFLEGPISAPLAPPSAVDLRQREERRRKEEDEREQSIQWARQQWAKAIPAPGTLVQIYLRRRGITLIPPPSLRFLPRCRHSFTDSVHPAMIAAVQDVNRRVVGIHRTFLTRDGYKADLKPNKMMAAQTSGCAVRFAPPAPTLCIAEGIETALSVMMAIPDAAVWAVLSIGNMARLVLPPLVRELRIYADNDNKDPVAGGKSVAAAVDKHRSDGRAVTVILPPPGMDFNDLLRVGGEQ